MIFAGKLTEILGAIWLGAFVVAGFVDYSPKPFANQETRSSRLSRQLQQHPWVFIGLLFLWLIIIVSLVVHAMMVGRQ